MPKNAYKDPAELRKFTGFHLHPVAVLEAKRQAEKEGVSMSRYIETLILKTSGLPLP